MAWKCILGDWFGHDCNFTVGAILLLALFLCVIFLFCTDNHHHHQAQPGYATYQPRPRPSAPPQYPVYPQPQATGKPIYTVSLDDRDGSVPGRYTSTESYSTPSHTIHNIKTTDPDHAAKDIEVHYHSDKNMAHTWPKPTINNNGDLEITDHGNNMQGHIEVQSNGNKIAHQEVTPE